DPPSPDQAARLLNLVWAEDEEFGLYPVDRVHDRRPPRRGKRPRARTSLTSRASRSAWPATTWSSRASTSRRHPRTARAASCLSTCWLASYSKSVSSAVAPRPGLSASSCPRTRSRPPRPLQGREPWEPGHDDASVSPVRPPGRHHELAEGAPALLRHPDPGRGHRPEHRRRTPRARGGLHRPEVLRPVH